MLGKIEYGALVEGAAAMGFTDLPASEDVDEAMKADEGFLRKVHHALLDLHLQDGKLLCPETGRPFAVKDGIPNMLLHEDEV
jgi:multifunctional methyltransferase subunit TRM112